MGPTFPRVQPRGKRKQLLQSLGCGLPCRPRRQAAPRMVFAKADKAADMEDGGRANRPPAAHTAGGLAGLTATRGTYGNKKHLTHPSTLPWTYPRPVAVGRRRRRRGLGRKKEAKPALAPAAAAPPTPGPQGP